MKSFVTYVFIIIFQIYIREIEIKNIFSSWHYSQSSQLAESLFKVPMPKMRRNITYRSFVKSYVLLRSKDYLILPYCYQLRYIYFLSLFKLNCKHVFSKKIYSNYNFDYMHNAHRYFINKYYLLLFPLKKTYTYIVPTNYMDFWISFKDF